MGGGTITRCACGRLIIYGQRCVCTPIPPRSCDCTFEGNVQHIGALCRQAITAAWSKALGSHRG